MKAAQSVKASAERLAQKRVILIAPEKRTVPPAPEAIWSRGWFALQVWSGWEWRVLRGLRAAGFDVFLPVATHWNASRFRVRRQLERSLLTGYVFVGVGRTGARRISDDDRAKLRAIEGVVAVLGDAGGPLNVPTENVVELAGEIAAGTYDATTEAHPVGTNVSVLKGPFVGFSAKTDQPIASTAALDDTIRLLLRIMGRDTVMHVPLADLQVIA